MSNMELRSTRSRSRTPFLTQEIYESETSVVGNHVEKKVVKTTRNSTIVQKTTRQTANGSIDEVNTIRQTDSAAGSGRKSLRNRVLKTSDYSSDDAENEVSTSGTIKQNERNQLMEDARTLTDDTDMPALELYKRSGRYWDVYPKTDWTYSQYSKDRIEIAPGVVAMPNMSRKTIHSLDESNSFLETSQYTENVAHKNTNTDQSLFRSKWSHDGSWNANNHKSYEEFQIRRRTHTRWSKIRETVLAVFISVFTVISSIFRYGYRIQMRVFSQIHRAASKVMLWDTYLLWKSRSGNKSRNLLLLCLLPLLLFGGLWFLSGLSGAIYGLFSNVTVTPVTLIPALPSWRTVEDASKPAGGFERNVASETERIVKITEKVYVEPPSADEIAGSLTKEQLEAIASAVKDSLNLNLNRADVNSDELVAKIINNPEFNNIITNNYRNQEAGNDNAKLLEQQQVLIDTLLKEIESIKREILLNNKLRSDDYLRLSLDMRKCCDKRPVVNVEAYVTSMLNNPDFLNKQKGLNDWLRSLYVAKRELELRLGNVTHNMDSKLSALIENDSDVLLKKIVDRIDLQTTNGPTDDALIKKIVKDALAIYDADRTGLVDYAMERMGGQVVTTRCTELYHHGKAVFSIMGIPLWHGTNTPRTAITPSVAPGDCWAFQNFPGFIVIKLSNRIKVEAFTVEHISKLLLPDGKMDSAPKDFEVYGLREENDPDPVPLGSYRYQYDGEPLQYFAVEQNDRVFDMVEVRIVSNHGNPNYTCLYRFRVHGKLVHEEEEGGR